MRNGLIIVLLVVAAGVAGWWLLGRNPMPETAPVAVDVAPPATEVPVAAPPAEMPGAADGDLSERVATPAEEMLAAAPVLPDLDLSDAFVRAELVVDGVPEAWVAQEELVRRFASFAEAAAQGDYPRRQMSVFGFRGAFQVEVIDDGRYLVDPANHGRYDTLLDLLEEVSPLEAAHLVRVIEPLAAEALAELGLEGKVRALLAEGLGQVMNVPVLDEPPELVRPNVLYLYADPSLEALTPLQKLLLRSGPGNVLRAQAWARRFAGALGVRPVLREP